MVTGYILLFICFILLMKYVARRTTVMTVNRFLKMVHLPLGILVIGLVAVHIMATVNVWGARANFVIISGMITAVVIVLMAVSYFLRKRLKGSWIKVHRAIAFVLVIGIVAHIVTYYVDFISYKNSVAAIAVAQVDMSKLKDGSYEGEYDVGYIKAKVCVEIKGNKIETIKILEHKTERGKKAEKIVEEIKSKQSTKVDAVSGATNSSLVIEKAVEDALGKAV